MSLEHKVVVDWGTTNFRAWRFDDRGAIAGTHTAAAGIMSVPDGAFEDVLEREIGQWLAPGVSVLLSGMITSRNGWRETPYIEVPASLADLNKGAVTMAARSGAMLHFLPGVSMRSPTPDVMRGEEIQVFGALDGEATATVILPGTHSKWVIAQAGRIVSFRTFFTGEMFGLLTTHSIIGKVPGVGEPSPDAFAEGVRHAGSSDAGLLNEIFQLRAGALLGAFAPQDVGERLSGLLIGREILGGMMPGGIGKTFLLVGEPALCERYRMAFAHFGVTAAMGPAQATVEGFRKLVAVT